MKRRVVITGGAGFIGTNLAARLLSRDNSVVIFDNFSRRGSESNAAWLRERHGKQLTIVRGDVRDPDAVRRTVEGADLVAHLAAQVAVTTSVEDPVGDFEVNAAGTLHILEAMRTRAPRATLIFTSTNKVYGGMEDVSLVEGKTRYRYKRMAGISEGRPLEFWSPYGCSKGAADQYVLDYSRIYGLRTVVFRMSCIYGPRQFGNEEQGWVAHLVISTLLGRPVTIYGDGKQVRDLLYVDDLVRAFSLAADRIEKTAGKVYNIGGGPENTISVWAEFGPMLMRLTGRRPQVAYQDWRPGDQKVYVSDTRRAFLDFGWRPRVSTQTGVSRLHSWVKENLPLFTEQPAVRPRPAAAARAKGTTAAARAQS